MKELILDSLQGCVPVLLNGDQSCGDSFIELLNNIKCVYMARGKYVLTGNFRITRGD